jgi:Thioredoxin
MTRVLLAAGLAVVAVVVAAVARRRSSVDAPSQPAWAAPAQLDRADFDRPDAPQLVVVFSSATCSTCASMVTKAEALSSRSVAVQEVEVTARPDLHARYGIEAVPITVVADAEGVVRASFVGPASAADLWAALA